MKRRATTLDDLAIAIVDLGTMMSAQIGDIHGQLGGLRSDVDTLKSDVQVLKSDVQELKSDVRVLKIDMREVKNDIRDHGQHIGGLENEMKATRSDIKELYNLRTA